MKTEMLFEPEENLSLDGLELTCQLISVSCSSRKVNIYVRNTTQHDITVPTKVCVRKKDGSLRLCIGYRGLNKKTIQDWHPIPCIQETLDGPGGNAWFSVLDQGKAYHQGSVSEDSKKFTAFTTLWGLYEWNRIPFGFTNAPSAFQQSMEESLEGFRDKICIPYLDDVLVYSKTFTQHVEAVKAVLKQQQTWGMKLRPDKCDLFKNEVCYVGKVISAESYRMDKKEEVAVQVLKTTPPINIKELRKLLGFLGYYRSYVQDFSRHAKCLYDRFQQT